MAFRFDVKQLTELLSVSHHQKLFFKAPHQKLVLPVCTLYVLKVFKVGTRYFWQFLLEGLCIINDNKNDTNQNNSV